MRKLQSCIIPAGRSAGRRPLGKVHLIESTNCRSPALPLHREPTPGRGRLGLLRTSTIYPAFQKCATFLNDKFFGPAGSFWCVPRLQLHQDQMRQIRLDGGANGDIRTIRHFPIRPGKTSPATLIWQRRLSRWILNFHLARLNLECSPPVCWPAGWQHYRPQPAPQPRLQCNDLNLLRGILECFRCQLDCDSGWQKEGNIQI